MLERNWSCWILCVCLSYHYAMRYTKSFWNPQFGSDNELLLATHYTHHSSSIIKIVIVMSRKKLQMHAFIQTQRKTRIVFRNSLYPIPLSTHTYFHCLTLSPAKCRVESLNKVLSHLQLPLVSTIWRYRWYKMQRCNYLTWFIHRFYILLYLIVHVCVSQRFIWSILLHCLLWQIPGENAYIHKIFHT